MDSGRSTDGDRVDHDAGQTQRTRPEDTAPTRAMPPGGHPPPPPRKPLPKAFAGYEIEGELGRGGMGVVYLARQTDLNRRVALKMLTGHYGPDELQRFVDEAETAAGLNHTNIAHIYEVGEHDGAPFFSMEYVEGGSLADRLRDKLPDSQSAAELMISVARAMHYAHQNGIVHRDMKPANILLDLDGVPKVADFGIAKRLNDDSQLTQTGSVIGTPTYMAPEQAKGNSRHVGPAADIYSLGAILYEMLAGRPPFLPQDSEAALTIRVLTEDPVSPAWHNPEIPRDLETICMKCLAKEPHNRYVSAAAMAEDLRRFLDDESILAKPPNTVVNTVKWVRRHPWKFVGTATGLLVGIAALFFLTRWELYQRPRFEYATQVVWTNGSLEPLSTISSSSGSHSASYLRLTRRGRFGPIVKVEILNPRGNPAVLRRTFTDEKIPIYIEGVAGAQPFTEKLPETSSVDFTYDGNDVQEATSRDRNGQVNWRIIYDRVASSGSTARARFSNLRGFEASSQSSASSMEFERDTKGRDIKISFFNSSGKPAANGEGVFGYKIERDEQGRVITLVNLGADEKPVANRTGLTAFGLKWDKGGVRMEPRDGQGKPATWNGINAMVTEEDAWGNPIRVSALGPDGQPVRSDANPWSVQEMKRNENGELTQRTFFKADASGSLKQISQADFSYDEFGHPADMKFTGNTSWRSAMTYDVKGNVTEEKYLNPNGEPVLGEKGYAITRSTYVSSSQGLRIEQTYFDAAGNKTYCTSGYHRLINEYDVTGLLKRMTMDEHDPKQYKYYRYVTEPEYDSKGRSRRNVSRFEDAQGQLATNADLANTSEEDSYDENGRLVQEWKLGADVASIGGPVLRVDTEWEANGKMKSRVRQVCDANRQPLSVVPNGNAARREEVFDFNEQRERIYETGFDETAVGFSSREAKFFGGNFQSVTHKQRDGTTLSSVAVIISQILPPENQPKSAELKAGDQLVSSNGNPVTSAYGFVFAGAFPGGWIEVIRDGKRIRIDGFNPGSLGVVLEDRGKVKTDQKKVS